MLATSLEVSASAREYCCRDGISVQLERIEIVAPRFDVLMPIQNLRFGLDLQAAQLLLEARHGARQFGQIEVDRVDLLIEASAEDAHLPGIVEHGIEQIRIDARHFHAFRRGALASGQYRRAAQLEARSESSLAAAAGSAAHCCTEATAADAAQIAPRGPAAARRGGRRAGAAARGAVRRQRRTRRAECASGFAKSRICAIKRGRAARQRAVAHQIAHAREFIEAGLHDGVRMIVAGHGAAVDLDHQCLELMTQIAHGGDARHSGAAFQGVQLTLQLRDSLLVLAVAIPGGQRYLRRLEQFGRLFAVDVRDLVIELLGRRRGFDFHRRGRGGRSPRSRGVVLPQLGHRLGHGVGCGLGD